MLRNKNKSIKKNVLLYFSKNLLTCPCIYIYIYIYILRNNFIINIIRFLLCFINSFANYFAAFITDCGNGKLNSLKFMSYHFFPFDVILL